MFCYLNFLWFAFLVDLLHEKVRSETALFRRVNVVSETLMFEAIGPNIRKNKFTVKVVLY